MGLPAGTAGLTRHVSFTTEFVSLGLSRLCLTLVMPRLLTHPRAMRGDASAGFWRGDGDVSDASDWFKAI